VQFFGPYIETGIFADNSIVDLDYRVKGLTIGIEELSKCGIVAFQGTAMA
jgi:hypothetical protein